MKSSSNLIKTKVILDHKYIIEGRMVRKIEIRQYKKEEKTRPKEYLLTIYMKTEKEEIELDYLEKPTSNKDVFDEICDFLSNYNGLTSTINRMFIELDRKTDKETII
jgi:hypothetical protein